MITGAFCVIEALILEFGLLLELIAISVLAHQTVICAAALATRYRPREDSSDIEETKGLSGKIAVPSTTASKQLTSRSSQRGDLEIRSS